MGKFFNGKVKNDKEKYIKLGVIGGGVLLIIIIIMMIMANNRAGKNAVLTLKESLDVEVNTELPDKMDYFSEFENFDKEKVTVDDSGVDIKTVGVYEVTVSAKGLGEEDVVVNVVDKTAPTLVTKNLNLETGEYYSAEDFVNSCTDNYDEGCTVEFFTGGKDQNGNPIDYSSYTLEGTYTVMIIAKDESENTTEAKSATLVIGKGGNGGGGTVVPPANCSYGDLTVKTDLPYPIAVIVGDKNSNCALDRDLWDNDNTKAPAVTFYQQDFERLKTQLGDTLKEKFPNGAKTVVKPNYITVLNQSTKGLVGYAIYVKVYIMDATSSGEVMVESNLKMSYYLRSDKTRDYDVNVYDITQ